MSDDQSESVEFPRLNEKQAYITILGLHNALGRPLSAYAASLGPQRSDEFAKFRTSLVNDLKNDPILGLRQEDEADAVLAAFKIVESAFLIAAKGNGWKSD